jgi:hypothetical protein
VKEDGGGLGGEEVKEVEEEVEEEGSRRGRCGKGWLRAGFRVVAGSRDIKGASSSQLLKLCVRQNGHRYLHSSEFLDMSGMLCFVTRVAIFFLKYCGRGVLNLRGR